MKTPEDSTKNDQTPHVVHISQYLNQLLTKKSFPISTPIRVTYHDPCHLGRHTGVFEEPRQLIQKMRHVELTEMPRNRLNAWCCGAGAGVKSAFKDWSVEIAEQRVQEALDLQKDGKGSIKYIVTTCPFCDRNLSDAIISMRQKEITGSQDIELVDLYILCVDACNFNQLIFVMLFLMCLFRFQNLDFSIYFLFGLQFRLKFVCHHGSEFQN